MVIFLGSNTLTTFQFQSKQRNWYYCQVAKLNALLHTFKHLPFTGRTQCSPYQAVTGKIYCLKQQQVTVLTACNLLKVY